MKRYLVAIALLALVAQVGCRRSEFASHLSASVHRVLENPSRIELFQVVNQFDVPENRYAALLRTGPVVAGYPVAKTVSVGTTFGRDLGRALLDNRIYHPDGQIWACLFEPHHVALFSRGNERVAAVICFKCGDIQILSGAKLQNGYPIQSLSPAGGKRLYQLISGKLAV